MIITYEEFIAKLNMRVKENEEFYYNLLITVIKNPNRFTGVFRLSNAKTKLIQNVTQSREIKFGDFMEDIITLYIDKMGYQNLPKSIGCDADGNPLSADQVFTDGNTVYLIEQKIRDDHDSTKKRGQYQNFKKKFTLLQGQHASKRISASMWFIDSSLVKNKNYYCAEAGLEKSENIEINIFYGGDIFKELFCKEDIWQEILDHLKNNKQERSSDLLAIPDFDRSDEMLYALKKLKAEQKTLYKKLMSEAELYKQLRSELFPTGFNFERVGDIK